MQNIFVGLRNDDKNGYKCSMESSQKCSRLLVSKEVATYKMNRLIILVACVLGTVTAGRILQRDWQRDTGTVDQRIERMSYQDLQRQKFLLDVVQRVQQPLQQDDLIQLDQGLIMDTDRYRGGIDGEMQRIIDLDRQRRLLDERQICSIRNVEHVQQLRGIYRLLVRAIDFETLQRNVVYLRRHINPVLLINALTMAIRDREDSQSLIMPALQELLPELYLDQQTIERVQQQQLELERSPRRSLIDLVGLGQRMGQVNPMMRIIMPWRDLHLQMALKRQQVQQQTQSRVVLATETSSQEQDITLLTEDIGMRNFMQNLIQELALYEDNSNIRQLLPENDFYMGREMELEQRRQDYGDIDSQRLMGVNRRRMQNEDSISEQILRRDIDVNEDVQSGRRVPLQRNIGQGVSQIFGRRTTDDVSELPTVDIRSDRLLHVGRRRQNLNLNRVDPEEEQLQSRYVRVVRGERLSEGRRVVQEQFGKYGINDEDIRPINKRMRNVERRGDDVEYSTDNLQTVSRDDERLVHINRRRLGQTVDDMMPRRINRIGEGRRVDGVSTMKDEDIVQLIRSDNRLSQLSDEDITELVRLNRQRKEQTQQERFMGIVRGDRLSEVRRVDQWQQVQGQGQGQGQLRSTLRNINQEEDVDRLTDSLPTVRRDDERLVHVNRRRLGQPMDNIATRRISRIGEGRRVGDVDPMTEEDIMRLIRSDNRLSQLDDEEIIEMLRRNRQRKVQEQQDIEEHTKVEQGHRYRRSLVDSVEERTSRRSEVLLHTLRQLLARINQECISVRLGSDELINDSRQMLKNPDQGQRYAMRLNEMRLDSRNNRDLIEQINIIESRLQQVIGQLIRGVSRSGVQQIDEQLRIERVIGDVLMGRLGDIGILSIVREQLQDTNVQMDRLGLGVSLNDRVLQYTLRRIIRIVDEQREQLMGVYKPEQLDMRDVKINDVRVSKLRTRIEDYDMDVSNLLEQPQQVQMIVRQRRLSNKPFTIDMDISSERTQDVIIRIFLGPGQDASGRVLNLEQSRSDFVLLDAINTQLQSGRNRIQQRSTDIGWTTRDATPYSEIYRRVMTTLRGQQEPVMMTELVGENGRFPQRLLLPRGRPEGLPMQLLVIVSPVERLEREQQVRMERIGGVMGLSLATLMDSRPLGFPLDRRIGNEQELLQLSNVQMQEVVIVQEN